MGKKRTITEQFFDFIADNAVPFTLFLTLVFFLKIIHEIL